MLRTPDVATLKRKNKVHVSKTMSLVKSWYVLGPVAAEHIAGPDFIPIPHYMDTDAYQIGHIFVQTGSQVISIKQCI